MAESIVEQSMKAGAMHAEALVTRRPVSFAPPRGYLIAEGDSWFDYPFFQDILEALEEDHGFRIRSAAHHGDTAEGMAYEDNQLDKLRKVFAELAEDNDAAKSKTPKAILLSAGGNDLAHIIQHILNHKRSGLPVINEDIVRGLFEVRVKASIASLIGSVMVFCQQYFGKDIPILIHGYGRPVPDGRGFPILGLSGPWLKPGFAAKGYVTVDPQTQAELQQNADVIGSLIDRFNTVLSDIARSPSSRGVVKYVDLRGAFSNVAAGAAYLQDWRDEMHATARGFKAAAQIIAGLI